MTQSFDQGLSERSQAGANFNHGLSGLRVDGIDDGIDDATVRQKMLPKPLARDVFH
jgi:hypothetical protein